MKMINRIQIGLLVAVFSQITLASEITDTYISGDTLTTTTMENIKSAVNDNNSRINTNTGDINTNGINIGINTSAISDHESRITALEGSGGTTTKRIFINTYGVNIGGSATYAQGFSDSGSIRFPENATSPTADYNFMIPNDHVPNTSLTIEIVWRSTGTTGGVLIRNNWGTRQRVGAVAFDFNATGEAAVNTSSSAVETVFKSTMTLPAGSNFTAGDYISHGIFRRSTETSDTSTDDIVIGGISISYTAFE